MKSKKGQFIISLMILVLTLAGLVLVIFASANKEIEGKTIGEDQIIMLESYDEAEMVRVYVTLAAKYSAYSAMKNSGCPINDESAFEANFFKTFESYLTNYPQNRDFETTFPRIESIKSDITFTNANNKVMIKSTELIPIQIKSTEMKLNDRFIATKVMPMFETEISCTTFKEEIKSKLSF